MRLRWYINWSARRLILAQPPPGPRMVEKQTPHQSVREMARRQRQRR